MGLVKPDRVQITKLEKIWEKSLDEIYHATHGSVCAQRGEFENLAMYNQPTNRQQ